MDGNNPNDSSRGPINDYLPGEECRTIEEILQTHAQGEVTLTELKPYYPGTLPRNAGVQTVFTHTTPASFQAVCEIIQDGNIADQGGDKDHPWRMHLAQYQHILLEGLTRQESNGPLILNSESLAKVLHDRGYLNHYLMIINPAHEGIPVARRIALDIPSKGTFLFQPSKDFPDGWTFADPVPLVLTRGTEEPVPIAWSVFDGSFDLKQVLATGEKVGKKTHHRANPVALGNFIYIRELDEFVHRRTPWNAMPAKRLSNNFANCCTNDGDLAKALIRDVNLYEVDGFSFNPTRPGITFTDETGKRVLNQFRRNSLVPRKGKGIKPFTDFLRSWGLPEKDFQILLYWLRHVIRFQRPSWGLLVVSEEQGIGKNTMAEFIRYIHGSWNTAMIGPNNLTDDRREWLINKTLIIVSEIYAGGNWKAYHKVKDLVTETAATVDPKYRNAFETELWFSIMMFSNELAALKMDKDDRRFAVLHSKKPKKYSPEQFAALRKWFLADGGAEAVMYWADNISQAQIAKWADFGLYKDAPMTDSKQEMIKESRDNWVKQLEEDVEDWDYVVLQDIRDWLDESGFGKHSIGKIRSKMSEIGFAPVESRLSDGGHENTAGQVTVGNYGSVVYKFSTGGKPVRLNIYGRIGEDGKGATAPTSHQFTLMLERNSDNPVMLARNGKLRSLEIDSPI